MSGYKVIPSREANDLTKLSLAPGDERFDLQEMRSRGVTPLQIAVRHKWGILVFAVLVTTVVGLAVSKLPVRYTAGASVMIDPRQPRVSSGESLLPSQIVDLDLLRTYMEALRSPSLVLNVVQQLKLMTVPEYCEERRGWGDTLSSLFVKPFGHARDRAGGAASCNTSVEAAAKRLAPSLSFSNDGRSYVIAISAVAGTPELAASVANAYANAFIARRRQQQAVLTDQADVWLRTHLAQLRADVLTADNAVQQQRQGGQLTNLRGQTLLGQSLSEMNSQLILATSELAQKRSTLRELEDAAHSGAGADASAPVLASPIIQGLLERESTLAAAQAEFRTRLGSANTELVANSAQLARVRLQLRTEINKAVASVRGEVEALEARCTSLQSDVQDLQLQVGKQGIADIRLQDLERDLVSARSHYDEAALRLEQIHVEAAMQRADVQLVVEASPPDFPSFPRVRMIVTGTFLAMLGVGAALACVLELLSRVFSTPEQVEEQTGVRVLGLFPRLPSARNKPQDALAADPGSREAEAMQAVFAGLIGGRHHDETRGGRVLMVTSALPGEGKTSFSVALGRAAAGRGLAVVVVDCDLRRSGMRSHFPPASLEEVLAADPDPVPRIEPNPGFADLVIDPVAGLHVLVTRARPDNPHAVLASAGLPRALEQLREKYDVVIIDTPPVLAVPDVMSVAPMADDVVMLVAWRHSPRTAVNAALKALRRGHVQVNGIVLTKVDLRRLARADTDSSYYARLYPSYHGLTRG